MLCDTAAHVVCGRVSVDVQWPFVYLFVPLPSSVPNGPAYVVLTGTNGVLPNHLSVTVASDRP